MGLSKSKSNGRGLLRPLIAAISLFVLMTATMLSTSIFIKIVCIALNGFVVAGFFNGMHFCGHNSLFGHRNLNTFFGSLFATYIGMNFSSYRYFHYQHHRHTTVPGDSEPGGELKGLLHYLFCALNWDYIYAFQRLSIMSLFGYSPFFITTKKQAREVRIDAAILLLWMAGLIGLTIQFPMFMLLAYLIPLQIAYTLNFFLVIGEHYDVESGTNGLSNTRSFQVRNPLFHFFHYNGHLHAAHHHFPSLAPWQVPQAHDTIASELKFEPITYLEMNRRITRDLWNRRNLPASAPPTDRELSFNYKLEKSR
jgi:fatty acid desaturase